MLHWAAASGNTDMLAFLLERAVDPNMQSYAGQTPLQVAAGRGHDACLRLLLSENAQPDLGDTRPPDSRLAQRHPELYDTSSVSPSLHMYGMHAKISERRYPRLPAAVCPDPS